MSPADDELEPIRESCKGLYYPGESDEPIVPFEWPSAPGVKGARAAVAAKEPKGVNIEQAEPEAFFAELEDGRQAEGFRKLRRALESTLFDLRVIRAGEVRIAVYLIGRAPGGGWAGVRTVSVET